MQRREFIAASAAAFIVPPLPAAWIQPPTEEPKVNSAGFLGGIEVVYMLLTVAVNGKQVYRGPAKHCPQIETLASAGDTVSFGSEVEYRTVRLPDGP